MVNERIALAMDIGGTKTIVGVVDERGVILEQKRFATDTKIGPERHFARCIEAAQSCMLSLNITESDISGIGVTLPGLADSREAVLLYAPFSGWRDVHVREQLKESFPQLRVEAANDVNACALAERLFGEAGGDANYLWVTVSTGIGGGLVIGGQIYEGSHHIAGEIGHLVVEWDRPKLCGCGNLGCLEAHASGTAITAMAAALSQDGAFHRFLQASGGEPNAEWAAKAAAAGIAEAQAMFDEAGMYIGRALAAAANLLNPDAVYIGGGVSLSLPLLEPAMRRAFERAVIGDSNKALPIKHTGLGYEAGLLGAAALIFA